MGPLTLPERWEPEYTGTHTHACMQFLHTHACVQTHTCTHSHACTFAHPLTCMHTAQVHALLCECTCIHMHTPAEQCSTHQAMQKSCFLHQQAHAELHSRGSLETLTSAFSLHLNQCLLCFELALHVSSLGSPSVSLPTPFWLLFSVCHALRDQGPGDLLGTGFRAQAF